jgi:hypothetical protein
VLAEFHERVEHKSDGSISACLEELDVRFREQVFERQAIRERLQ